MPKDSDKISPELSRPRFELLVNSVIDYAIYMLDASGRVVSWNPGARRFKGYEAEEIIGHHFSRFFPEEDRAAGAPDRALKTAATEGKFEAEGWRVRKDGTRFWAHVVIDPVRDEEGRLIGFAKITRDNSEKKAAQEEIESARAALFQSQKLQALGELTGGIAHDFNNLMTVIRGAADMLRRKDLAAERRERYLAAIIDTADRATTLIGHLLAFARRQPLEPEVLDLNLRADAIADILERTLGGTITVVLDLQTGLWPAEVDAAQLETALLNAAFNARDAMPSGGQITLATRNHPAVPGSGGEDMVSISLTDTGEGMTEEVIGRVFEPFFTTKPVGKGTGLGLSQIHGFAAQTGGRAEIQSEPGKGTVLRILLPRSHKALAARRSASLPLSRGGEGLQALLVEDNEQVRDFASALLQDLGYSVLAADSAEQALQMLETERPDILFSDIVMPGRSGIGLAELVRQRWPDLPILLTSGYSEEIVAGIGADFDLLRKPYDASTLSIALATALSGMENRVA